MKATLKFAFIGLCKKFGTPPTLSGSLTMGDDAMQVDEATRRPKPYDVRASPPHHSSLTLHSQRGARGRGPKPRAPDGQWTHDRAPKETIPAGVIKATRQAAAAQQANVTNEPSARLVVSGLHYEVTEKDLAVS